MARLCAWHHLHGSVTSGFFGCISSDTLSASPTVPVTPPQTYLTLSLRNLGYTTTQANLLSIPSKVLGMILLLVFCYLSEIINSRVISTVLLQFWALPLLIALYTFNEQTSQWVYFAVVTLIAGFPYVHPIQVAWASTNSSGVGTRTVSASIYNMFVQAGGIISVSTSLHHLWLNLDSLTHDHRRRTSIETTIRCGWLDISQRGQPTDSWLSYYSLSVSLPAS